VATTDASVLISGESGTGKELIARAIHTRSRRSEGPFIPANCAAIPESLLESELFGHERGAFTGADTMKRGLMEHANGGTFLLDEVCEMSQELQAKLLRALQERHVRRVGGKEELPVDIRVVAATNRDPERAVEEGVLREDLYFRLNVVPIRVPPLRERREDVLPLVRHYLQEFAERYERAALRLSAEAIGALESYAWPGNVRELQNLTERIVSLAAPGQEITPRELPAAVAGVDAPVDAGRLFRTDRPFHEAKEMAVDTFERAYLRTLMAESDGNISRAARKADVSRKTIHRLLRKHDLDASELSGEASAGAEEEEAAPPATGTGG
ncbi:MAG: sigma-54 interaction domain-containing protein, partial [Gemmatimonadota bacterium]